MTQSKRTPGQIAYETELEYCPNYHDGAPRPSWDQLPDYAKSSWERNPTPRAWAMKYKKEEA